MAFNVGAILATLSLDSGGFKRGFLEAEAVTSTFGQTFATAVTNPVLGAISLFKQLGGAAVAGVTAAAGVVGDFADAAEALDNLSKRTGISTALLQGLDFVLQDAGEEAGTFRAAIDAMARKLGDAETDGGRTVAQLKKIGLTLEDLQGLGKDQVFYTLLDSIQRMEDPFQRAAYAADFFDRTVGIKLISTIDGGSAALKRFITDNKEAGRIMSVDAVKAGLKLDAALDGLNKTLGGLKTSFASAALEGLAEGLGDAGDGAESAARFLKESLTPAIREASREAGVFISQIDEAVRTTKNWFDLLSGLSGVLNVFEPGEAAKSYLQAANGYNQIFGNDGIGALGALNIFDPASAARKMAQAQNEAAAMLSARPPTARGK